LVSLVYLFILEKCALVLITLVIVFFMAGLTFLAFFFHKTYTELQEDDDPHNDSEKTYFYLAIITISVEAILLLCFCCLWSRIKLAARIIQATADYITDVKRIIIVPIIMAIALIGYLLWWSYSGAHIFSVGTTEWDDSLPWGDVKWTKLTE
jgi:flagellar basal body-associated protein FliL